MGSKFNKFEKSLKKCFRYDEKAYIFIAVMSAISLLIFFSYLISSDIFPKNFADNYWDSTKLILWIIIAIIYLFIFIPLMHKIKKEYFLFPTLLIGLFIIATKVDFLNNLWGIILLIIGILLILVLYYCFTKNYVKKVNWWIIATIIGILIFYLIGMSFIDAHVGEQKLDLRLNNCTNTHQKLGEIKCQGIDKHVIVGEEVICNIDSEYVITEGDVTFNLSNGTSNNEKLSKPINFIIPDNLVRIYFKFNAIKESKNNTICLSTANTIRYPTYYQFRENKLNFIKYMLALLGFALISIPLFVSNIKKWIKETKK